MDASVDGCPIRDPRVVDVIRRLDTSRTRPSMHAPGVDPHDAAQFADHGFSIQISQGELIYLLCRSLGARRVVDFATSVGMSALYMAAAVRDNGGGIVIGAELVAAKVQTARTNLQQAGLDAYAEIRHGDARQTLRDLGGPADFALIDGWPVADGPSLAYQVMQVVAPQLRVGAFVMNDNAEPDFLAMIRDPAGGFLTMTLPIKRGTELAWKAR